MIRAHPFFIDTSSLAASFVSKHRGKLPGSAVLPLRHWTSEDSDEVADRPLLQNWGAAANVLKRIRNHAAAAFNGETPDLGLAWIDHLIPDDVTPWDRVDGPYGEDIVRLRVCLIPSPGAYTFSGPASAVLAVGVVNEVDHRLPCSEINLGPAARTHLVVDLVRPVPLDVGVPEGDGAD